MTRRQKIYLLSLILGFVIFPGTISNPLTTTSDPPILADPVGSTLFRTPLLTSISDSIQIIGDNWTDNIEGISGNGTRADPYIVRNLRIENTDGISISIKNSQSYGIFINCTINNARGDGIAVLNSSHCTFDGTIINFTYVPLYLPRGVNLMQASDINLHNTTILNSNFSIHIYDSFNCTVSKSSINNSPNMPISVEDSLNITVSDNILTHSMGGISVGNSPNCILERNRILWPLYGGINIYNSSRCTLVENSVTQASAGIAIGVKSSPFSSLLRNEASDNGDEGIRVSLSPNSSLKENYAWNNLRDGFGLYSASNCSVIGNHASNNSQNGIKIARVSSCILTQNNFSENAFYGIFIDPDAFDNEIFDNILLDNLKGSMNSTINPTISGYSSQICLLIVGLMAISALSIKRKKI